LSRCRLVNPKDSRYADLVAARKACRACEGLLTNPAQIVGGAHDGDRVGPYTRWQGNLDAEVMIIGQDFADIESFERLEGWPGEDVGTNRTLVELLADAGIQIALPRRGEPEDRLFFTNAVLCLKRGAMGSRVPAACARTCAWLFLRPTIELVRPRAVITLGRVAFEAVLHAYGLPRSRRFLDVVRARRRVDLLGGAALFPMVHPSARVRATRSLAEQREDWRALGRWLAEQGRSAA
jgi:uracil-DNA glycosylase family 4